jgi:hypothetical protein
MPGPDQHIIRHQDPGTFHAARPPDHPTTRPTCRRSAGFATRFSRIASTIIAPEMTNGTSSQAVLTNPAAEIPHTNQSAAKPLMIMMPTFCTTHSIADKSTLHFRVICVNNYPRCPPPSPRLSRRQTRPILFHG